MKHISLLLFVCLILSCFCTSKEGEECSAESDCETDLICYNEICEMGPMLKFEIICISCEYQYGVRWRKYTANDWNEIDASKGESCNYTIGTTEIPSTCYPFEYPKSILSGYVLFHGEAKNSSGTWDELLPCITKNIDEISEPFQVDGGICV